MLGRLPTALVVGLLALARPAYAINGNALAFRSGGAQPFGTTAWRLDDNGYVGTYISLAEPGPVTVSINALGQSAGGGERLNLVIGDQVVGWNVAASAASYDHTFDLPAGTHFIRAEYNNAQDSEALRINALNVTGAALQNSNTNANALAAADTYIANYRQGPARLHLAGAVPGAPVHVELKRHDFRFGTAVGGTNLFGVNSFLNNANYSDFLLANFNTIVPSNAGKWAYNEGNRDFVTMSAVDRFFQYAEQHGLDVRLHNMLWGDSQQPAWATTLLNNANAGNAAAKADLRTEISERIDYYVGDGDGNMNDGDRARRYVEMDLLNEHSHQPKYWNVYGVDGVTEMFNEAAQAVDAAGASTRLYFNEYNVFQWGDSYANWYRQDVEEVVNAGGAIGGIGIQYYPSATTHPAAVHSPAKMQQILQNLSVTGLPISLTEFGVSTADGTTVDQAAGYLTDTIRMIFGTPAATTFMTWGFWENDVWNQAPLAALMDDNWNLTPAGAAYQQLMSEWDTDLMLQVDANGMVEFNGFYGDYEITIGGQSYPLTLAKGTTEYSLNVPPPNPGDFNGDGRVDAEDLQAWQTNLGLTEAALRGHGDANLDGNVDGVDFLAWQQNFGAGPPAGAAVAEPAAIAMALAACFGACVARRYKALNSRVPSGTLN